MPDDNDKALLRLRRLTGHIEDALLVLLLSGMIGLGVLQILLRNLFDMGLTWSDPLLRVDVLWLAMVGAMAATRDDNHIRIDILSRFLPAGAAAWARRFTDLATGTICAFLAWHSARFVIYEWRDGMLLFGAVPAWACEIVLPIGFGVMALRFLLRAISGQGPAPRP